MLRILALFAVTLVCEIILAPYAGCTACERPGWFGIAMTFAGLLMCVGGVESARWLLRESPAAKVDANIGDWSKLWLWLGIPCGLLLTWVMLASWLVSGYLSPQADFLLQAHAIPGAALWFACSFWGVRGVWKGSASGSVSRRLMSLAFLTNLLALGTVWVAYAPIWECAWKTIAAQFVMMGTYYCLIFNEIMLASVMLMAYFAYLGSKN